MKIDINNFDELILPIADELPVAMQEVFGGLLEFIANRGRINNSVAEESLQILSDYVNQHFEFVEEAEIAELDSQHTVYTESYEANEVIDYGIGSETETLEEAKIAVEDSVDRVEASAEPETEGLTEIEIMKSAIPGIPPEQFHIIEIIRKFTGNEPVSLKLITDNFESVRSFCKQVSAESKAMYESGLVPFGYSWNTVYMRLHNVINYDSTDFEITNEQ